MLETNSYTETQTQHNYTHQGHSKVHGKWKEKINFFVGQETLKPKHNGMFKNLVEINKEATCGL